MDLSNRGPTQAPSTPSPASHRKNKDNKLGRLTVLVGIIAVAILLIAVVVAVSFGGTKSESKFVDTTKLQAVFLNTGQVYFGNIKALNDKYFEVTNIYYLQTANGSSGNQNSSVSLVKLGCELHEPYDKMLINADQVTFWENLQDGGQVAKAVSTFEKQNPNGQKCADQSSSASSNSGNNAQSAGSNSSSNTGTKP
jgi:hypothetical protein